MPPIRRFDLDGVPCTALVPTAAPPWPVCLFLSGGGGSAEDLAVLAPLLGDLDVLIACASAPPFGFYLDGWDDFVASTLLDELRRRFDVAASVGLVGISMGGYGALRIAFDRPDAFRAVSVVAPMIEPSLDPHATPLRNRYHYPPEVPTSLREAEPPLARAVRNAELLRAYDLAIRIDAGSRDALNAHDGAEALHRTLWALDVPHEYHLLRDADHVGSTIPPRLAGAFAWVAARLRPAPGPDETAETLRAALAPLRDAAAREDPNMDRIYGLVP